MIYDLLIVLLAMAITGSWIAVQYIGQKHARRKIGDDIIEVRQQSRWSWIFQRTAVVLAVAVPIVATTMVIVSNGTFADLWLALARSLWLGSYAFGLHQGSLMLIGNRGISARGLAEARGDGIIPWDRVRDIRWDRDIGQTQWGVAFVVTGPKGRTGNVRLYIHRKMKGEVEQVLEEAVRRFLPQQQAALQPAELSAGSSPAFR